MARGRIARTGYAADRNCAAESLTQITGHSRFWSRFDVVARLRRGASCGTPVMRVLPVGLDGILRTTIHSFAQPLGMAQQVDPPSTRRLQTAVVQSLLQPHRARPELPLRCFRKAFRPHAALASPYPPP